MPLCTHRHREAGTRPGTRTAWVLGQPGPGVGQGAAAHEGGIVPPCRCESGLPSHSRLGVRLGPLVVQGAPQPRHAGLGALWPGSPSVGAQTHPRAGLGLKLGTCPLVPISCPAPLQFRPQSLFTRGEAGPTLWQDLYLRYVSGSFICGWDRQRPRRQGGAQPVHPTGPDTPLRTP